MWEQAEVIVVSRVISVAPPDLQESTPIHSSARLPAGKGTHTETRQKKKTCTHLRALPIDHHWEWDAFHSPSKKSVRFGRPGCQCFFCHLRLFVSVPSDVSVFVRARPRCVSLKADGNTPGRSGSDLMSQTHCLSVCLRFPAWRGAAHRGCWI